MKKTWKILDFKFFVGDVNSAIGFRPSWPRLPDRGPNR